MSRRHAGAQIHVGGARRGAPKPVIVDQGRAAAAAAKAAASHTGALAGIDAVYDAAFQRAGILRVLRSRRIVRRGGDAGDGEAAVPGDRLAILTNGGGVGVLATDALLDCGGVLAKLSADTMKALDAALPPTWSHGNPVDIIGDAPPKRYADALSTLLLDATGSRCRSGAQLSDGRCLGHRCGARPSCEAAKASDRTVLTNWLGAGAVQDARDLFAAARLADLRHARRSRARLFLSRALSARPGNPDGSAALGRRHDLSDETVGARRSSTRALKAGESGSTKRMSTPSARRLTEFQPRDPPSSSSRRRSGAPAPRNSSGEIALKIFSPDITHKSDVGGVALDLHADTMGPAAEDMLKRVEAAAPNARIAGFVCRR